MSRRTPSVTLTPRQRLSLGIAATVLAIGGLPWLSGPMTRLLAPTDQAPSAAAKAPSQTAHAGGQTTDGRRPSAAAGQPPADASPTPGGHPAQPGVLDNTALGLGGADDSPAEPPDHDREPPSPLDDSALFGAPDTLDGDPLDETNTHRDRPPADTTAEADAAVSKELTISPATLVRAALGSLLVGVLTAIVATLVGALLGLMSGYRGGLAERIAVRWFADGLDALPQFVVLVTAVALYRDLAGTEGDALLIAVGVLIGLVNSTQVLLVVHHQTRLIAGRKYVIAARLMGWGALRVVRHKIVPHLRHELIIPFTQLVIWGVFVETALSYLGFGPSSTGSTLGAQLHRIDPFARPDELAPAIVMCLMTVALAAALRSTGDAVDALYAKAPAQEAS